MAKDDPDRARRLADALRENLRRRKRQDRDRREPPMEGEGDEDETGRPAGG